MPNELNIITGQTGQTITARLATGVGFVGNAIECPELPMGSGRYSGNVANGTAAGTYDVVFYSGGVLSGGVLTGGSIIGSNPLHWDGTVEVNTRTVNTRVQSIPTNPLLTNDSRLNNLNAPIGNIPTTAPLDAAGIRDAVGLTSPNLNTQLGAIGTDTASVLSDTTTIKAKTNLLTFTGTDLRVTLDGEQVVVATNNDKSGYSLTQVFPPNFALLSINPSGHISRVTTCDTNSDMRGTNNALLADDYVAPPAASQNATAVRSELALELARIDQTISSRSVFNASLTSVNIGSVSGVPVTGPEDLGLSTADIQGVLTAQGLTSARAGYLDKLNFAGSISTFNPANQNVVIDTTDITQILNRVIFLDKWAKADEQIRDTTYTRLEAGTNTILIQKNVTKDGFDIDLTEA